MDELFDIVGLVGTAALYVAVFQFNQYLFGALEWIHGINWIFLPAAVRLGGVLFFGRWGALGIVFGTVLTRLPVWQDRPVLAALTTLASGASPLLACFLMRHCAGMEPSLKGLTSRALLACVLLYASINALLHNAVFYAFGIVHDVVGGTVSMLTGDVCGTLLVLYTLRGFLLFMGTHKQASH